MTWFASLRVIVLLKRIARASERQALALEQLASLQQQKFDLATIQKPLPRKAVISTFNLEEAEKEYTARMERTGG